MGNFDSNTYYSFRNKKILKNDLYKAILELFSNGDDALDIEFVCFMLNKKFNTIAITSKGLIKNLQLAQNTNTLKYKYVTQLFDRPDFIISDQYIEYQNETKQRELENNLVSYISTIGIENLRNIISYDINKYLSIFELISGGNSYENIVISEHLTVLIDFLKNHSENEIDRLIATNSFLKKLMQYEDNVHYYRKRFKLIINEINEKNFRYSLNNCNRWLKEEMHILGFDCVQDIVNADDLKIYLMIQSKHRDNIIRFLSFLKDDLSIYCHHVFKQVICFEGIKNGVDRSKYFEIIKLRCQGHNLQEIGDKYNYTRERIRQIEKKYIDRFKTFFFNISTYGIFRMVLGSNYCYTMKDIKRIFGRDYELFIYLFKKCNNDKIVILGNGLICDDCIINWYNSVQKYIQLMPKIFNKRDLNRYVREIDTILDNLGVLIKDSLIKGIISSTYEFGGVCYCKSDVSTKEKYIFILEKYYPKGIKIYNEEEIENFLHIYLQTFGSYELSMNYHAVQATLSRYTILCDKDKYKVKNDILISQDLLNDICKYIDDKPTPSVMTGEVFYAFKKRLKLEGIKNISFLYGILRELLSSRYSFKKKSKSRIGKIQT